MAHQKGTPEIEVIAYPPSAIPHRQIDSFVVADTLADVLAPNTSFGGVMARGATGGQWTDWANPTSGLTLNNVGFARFMNDGRVSYNPGEQGQGAGGFFVLPKESPYNSSISGMAGGGSNPLDWEAMEGTWVTVPSLKPANSGGGSAIYNSGSETRFKARTAVSMKANSSLRLDLSFLGQNRSGSVPDFEGRIGDDLSISARHGMPWALQRRTFDANGNPDWKILKTMPGTANLYGGKYRVAVKHLDGRLVWEVNDQAMWINDAKGPDKNGELEPQNWSWSEAPVIVTAQNARVRVETALFDYAAGGDGTVTRRIPLKINDGLVAQNTTPYSGGWQRNGAEMPVAVDYGDKYVSYTTTLKPTADGVHTPFLKHNLLAFSPVWTNPSGSGIDISKAVSGASITLAAPPEQAGSQGTLDIDGTILKDIPGAIANVKDYCPVTVRARWRDDSGVAGAWRGLFNGCFYGMSKSSNAFNNRSITATLRDQIVRLSGANAIIDYKFRPLGMILFDQLSPGSTNGGYNPDGSVAYNPEAPKKKPLYSGDCVKEIVRIQLGPDAVESLNGNGNSRRFFSSAEIPLYDGTGVLGTWLGLAEVFGLDLATGSLEGIPFPPPFFDDCLSWINKFGEDANADFFSGHVDRDTNDPPVLIYGQYIRYLDKAILFNLRDAIGVSTNVGAGGEIYTIQNLEDIDYLMSEASNETRPDSDYNRILVAADFPGTERNPLLPAMRMGEARLAASNPNSDAYSWSRTRVVKNNLGAVEGGAEYLARKTLEQIAATKKQWPSIIWRGEGRMQVGDVIQPFMDGEGSYEDMGINQRLFRSTSVIHKLTLTGEMTDWTTAVEARPMAKTEEARFRRVNNMPGPL